MARTIELGLRQLQEFRDIFSGAGSGETGSGSPIRGIVETLLQSQDKPIKVTPRSLRRILKFSEGLRGDVTYDRRVQIDTVLAEVKYDSQILDPDEEFGLFLPISPKTIHYAPRIPLRMALDRAISGHTENNNGHVVVVAGYSGSGVTSLLQDSAERHKRIDTLVVQIDARKIIQSNTDCGDDGEVDFFISALFKSIEDGWGLQGITERARQKQGWNFNELLISLRREWINDRSRFLNRRLLIVDHVDELGYESVNQLSRLVSQLAYNSLLYSKYGFNLMRSVLGVSLDRSLVPNTLGKNGASFIKIICPRLDRSDVSDLVEKMGLQPELGESLYSTYYGDTTLTHNTAISIARNEPKLVSGAVNQEPVTALTRQEKSEGLLRGLIHGNRMIYDECLSMLGTDRDLPIDRENALLVRYLLDCRFVNISDDKYFYFVNGSFKQKLSEILLREKDSLPEEKAKEEEPLSPTVYEPVLYPSYPRILSGIDKTGLLKPETALTVNRMLREGKSLYDHEVLDLIRELPRPVLIDIVDLLVSGEGQTLYLVPGIQEGIDRLRQNFTVILVDSESEQREADEKYQFLLDSGLFNDAIVFISGINCWRREHGSFELYSYEQERYSFVTERGLQVPEYNIMKYLLAPAFDRKFPIPYISNTGSRGNTSFNPGMFVMPTQRVTSYPEYDLLEAQIESRPILDKSARLAADQYASMGYNNSGSEYTFRHSIRRNMAYTRELRELVKGNPGLISSLKQLILQSEDEYNPGIQTIGSYQVSWNPFRKQWVITDAPENLLRAYVGKDITTLFDATRGTFLLPGQTVEDPDYGMRVTILGISHRDFDYGRIDRSSYLKVNIGENSFFVKKSTATIQPGYWEFDATVRGASLLDGTSRLRLNEPIFGYDDKRVSYFVSRWIDMHNFSSVAIIRNGSINDEGVKIEPENYNKAHASINRMELYVNRLMINAGLTVLDLGHNFFFGLDRVLQSDVVHSLLYNEIDGEFILLDFMTPEGLKNSTGGFKG